jgi:hypothetical protein
MFVETGVLINAVNGTAEPEVTVVPEEEALRYKKP